MKHKLLLILAAAAIVACNKSDAILRIERSYLTQNATSSGLTVKIPVRATGAYSAMVPSDASSWCHADVSGVVINLTVDPLGDGGNRETGITVSSSGCSDVTIKVTQSSVMAVDPPSAITLSNGLCGFSIKIISGTVVEFSYPDWISAIDDKWEAGEKTYTFQASELDPAVAESRSGKFIAKALDAGFRLEIPVTQVAYDNAAIKTLTDLWKTDMFASSPLETKSSRYSLLMDIEAMCDKLSRDDFQSYLAMQDKPAKEMEQSRDILALYNYAFERVLSEVQTTVVENGTAVIWMLYNAGFVVKTPSATFGLDINHRYAAKFAPYLDFICVSHSDSDHIDNTLMNEMDQAGKPVLSNFHNANPYCATSPGTVRISDIKITTSITDENATDTYCTTIHRIKCGEDAGGLEIIHTGDSSYDRNQFKECLDGSSTNVLILRYGAAAEAGIIGTLPGQTVPDYVLFSHLEELRHYPDQSPARARIANAFVNMDTNFAGTAVRGKCYLPFWGEKMVWKNGKLTHQ